MSSTRWPFSSGVVDCSSVSRTDEETSRDPSKVQQPTEIPLHHVSARVRQKKRKRETNNDSKLSSIFHDCNCERNCVSETWVKPKPKHDLRLLANLIGWENNASSLIGRAILKSQSEDEPKPKSNQFLNYFRQSSENRSKPYVLIGSFYRTSFL